MQARLTDIDTSEALRYLRVQGETPPELADALLAGALRPARITVQEIVKEEGRVSFSVAAGQEVEALRALHGAVWEG